MPPLKKVQKEDILKATLEILKKEDIESLNILFEIFNAIVTLSTSSVSILYIFLQWLLKYSCDFSKPFKNFSIVDVFDANENQIKEYDKKLEKKHIDLLIIMTCSSDTSLKRKYLNYFFISIMINFFSYFYIFFVYN